MPWNEPGSGNSGNRDPWGGGNRNRGGQNPDIDQIIENVRKRFGGGGGGRKTGAMPQFALLIVILLAVWAFKSVYTVQEGFQAIELRFGKYLETNGAGLNFAMWPIDQVFVINSQNIRTLEVGFRKDTGTQRGSVRAEAQMLTTDENIADVSLAVQYNIANVEDLLFKVGNIRDDRTQDLVIDSVVRGATESALREVVGSTTMDDLFNQGRAAVEIRTKELLQTILNRYETGINVVAVEMQAAVPPQEVREAFDNVNRADQKEQELIKDAKAYEERVVNEAEGTAARLIAEAKGYKEAVIARATGEGERFSRVLTEYEKAPEVTRKRLYIETMEQVLGNSNKVVIDQEGGNNMMYLPLDQIMRSSQRGNQSLIESAPTQSSNATNSAAQRNTNRGGR